MSYYIIYEEFASADESVEHAWLTEAPNELTVAQQWQQLRIADDVGGDDYQTITNWGNMYRLQAVIEIPVEDYMVLQKYFVTYKTGNK